VSREKSCRISEGCGKGISPMLFILVMDVLNSLFAKAGNEGLLQPLSQRMAGQRVSLYADNVAFIKTKAADH